MIRIRKVDHRYVRFVTAHCPSGESGLRILPYECIPPFHMDNEVEDAAKRLRNIFFPHSLPSLILSRPSPLSLDHVPLVHVEGLVATLGPPCVMVDVAHHPSLVAEARVETVPVPVALIRGRADTLQGGT